MQITVDTTRDSKEDIRKAVELLQRVLEERGGSSLCSSGESSSEPAPQPGLFGMFGNDDQSSGGSSHESSSEGSDGAPEDSGDGSPERIEIVPY